MRGVKRVRSGRRLGSGRYGEPTVPVRLPVSLQNVYDRWLENPGGFIEGHKAGQIAMRARAARKADSHAAIASMCDPSLMRSSGEAILALDIEEPGNA